MEGAFARFLQKLAPWNLAIFTATLIGCYLPQLIVTGNRGLRTPRVLSPAKHRQEHEMLMSYMMSFSAGVCLAVSFLFQIDGFQIFAVSNGAISPNSVAHGCVAAGLVLSVTFLAFFTFEQLATVVQTWHSWNCGGIAPCAVEVASQPLEAASVVRTITEHKSVRFEELRCSSLTQEYCRAGDALSFSVPLLDDRSITPPRGLRQCPLCYRREIAVAPLQGTQDKSWLVLTFLLTLFVIHSLAEGLGLGASACPNQRLQLGNTGTIAVAILLHKTLSAFAVGAALLRAGIQWAIMIAISIGFSLMSPLGSWIGFVSCSSSHMLSNSVNGYYMLIASGTFLFIALVEFLPNSFDEGSKGPGSISGRLWKTALFLSGCATVMLLELSSS